VATIKQEAEWDAELALARGRKTLKFQLLIAIQLPFSRIGNEASVKSIATDFTGCNIAVEMQNGFVVIVTNVSYNS
jgi:hypothetical protein